MPRLRPEELTEDQRRLYDEVLGGPRAQGRRSFPLTDTEGVLNGPFNAMLTSPKAGTALQRLGAVIRYECDLPGQVRELVILVVAAHLGSEFEWHAHESVARHIGLPDEIITAVKGGIDPAFTDPAQRTAHDLAIALLLTEDVPDTQFAAAIDALGAQGVFDVSTIVGYYWLLAAQLRLFRVGLPDALAGCGQDGNAAGELG
jgi:4-carboxymuconolactone decarboxylase